MSYYYIHGIQNQSSAIEGKPYFIVGVDENQKINVYYSTTDIILVQQLNSWINNCQIYVCQHPNQLLRHYLQEFSDNDLISLDITRLCENFTQTDLSEYPVDLDGLHHLLMSRLDGCYHGGFSGPAKLIEFVRENFPNEPLLDWK